MSKRKSKRLFEIKSFDEIMRMRKPGPRDIGRALIMSFCHTERETLRKNPGQALLTGEQLQRMISKITEEDMFIFHCYNGLLSWINIRRQEAKYHAERALSFSTMLLNAVEQEYLIAPARHAIETMRGLLTEEQKTEARRLGYDPDNPIYMGRLGIDPYTPNANKVEGNDTYPKKALTIMYDGGLAIDNSVKDKGDAMLDSVDMRDNGLTFSYKFVYTFNTIISIAADYIAIPELTVFALQAWPIDATIELLSCLRTEARKRVEKYSTDKKEAEIRLKALEHMKTLSIHDLRGMPQAAYDLAHSLIEADLSCFYPNCLEGYRLTNLLASWDIS